MVTATEISTERIAVLLVDDESAFREATAKRLELRGFRVSQAGSGEEAHKLLGDTQPDVVVCDLKMPAIDGLTLMRRHVAVTQSIGWIILTGQASVDTAVAGLKLGAVEYLQKPISIEDLESNIRQAFQRSHPARMFERYRADVGNRLMRFGIVGQSEHIEDLVVLIDKASKSDQPVLATGERGTGKELAARGIHDQSDRASRPFVTFNCSAMPETHQASELFGHVESAAGEFSGTKMGLIEVADRGTLFIDEVGDLSSANQAALLNFLESGEFRRQGDTRERTANVRLIAATSCDLAHMVQQGRYRDELYYRLNVLPLHLPPLRDRPEDIPLLVYHFMSRHAQRSGVAKRLSPEALVALQAHEWPGNVRELANTIERAATLADNFTIHVKDLKLGMQAGVATPEGMSTRLADIERQHILRVLDAHYGNKQAAAKALGISRMKLYRKLEQYGVGEESRS